MSQHRERVYAESDIEDLLEKAAAMGLPMNSAEHEDYSIEELERLVTVKQ
jgi:hypothetical protein